MYNQITNCAYSESLIYVGIHFILPLTLHHPFLLTNQVQFTFLASSEAGKGFPVISFFSFFRKCACFITEHGGVDNTLLFHGNLPLHTLVTQSEPETPDGF
jgi:hypothetical protein